MEHKGDFKERLYAVGLMKSTGKSENTYRQFAKLCHPACKCLLNEYDAENQTFNQSETYQTVTSGAWGGIWKVAEAIAREGGEVNSIKRLEVAKEGFRLCMYLLNYGYSSPKEAVEERCSSFITAVANSKYYKEAEFYIDFDELVGASEKFRYIGKAFTNSVSSRQVSSRQERLEYVMKEISRLESKKDSIEKKIEALKAEEQKLRGRAYLSPNLLLYGRKNSN